MIAELSKLLEAVLVPADWVGFRAVRERSTVRAMRDAIPTHNGRSLSQGLMVEVIAQGHLGYAAVNQIDRNSVEMAVEKAYRQAIAASRWGIYPITVAARPPVKGQFVSPQVKALDSLTAAEVNEILHQLCTTLKVSDQIVQTTATLATRTVETWLVSSSGSEGYQQMSFVESHYGATAQAGNIVQQRTNNGFRAHAYQGGWERVLTEDLEQRAQDIGEQAVELLTAAECPTERTTLVLAPDQMMLQIHESVGHPLELDRILGDERNYAGGSFITPADFGQRQYGSPLMNITFDPSVPGEFASYGFDDTGVPAQREYLIRAGRLERGLGSLESQQRSGIPGVACGRASSWNRPPIDRMANINLEPGTQSLAELLAGIERGVYMEANRSWSIDDQRYKFQFGCEYGRLIEQGQLTQTVRNPNYRATTPEFWHSLVGVGDRTTWETYGTPFCGKGEPNQLIRVGHGAPVCVFEQVDVFGGGS
jgi:predicted Zn-dependent protease